MASHKPSIITGISILALILAILSFTRGGTTANLLNGNTLGRIRGGGAISVCYAVWPPAVIKDAATGKLSGHDIDAINMIAEQAGATVNYVETTFGNMTAAIQSGQCDMGTSLFVKIPRAASVAFTKPLFFAGNSALVKQGEMRFKTIEDMNKPGIRIAVASGESGHIYAQQHLKNATIVPIDVDSSDLSRFLLEVTSGRADAGIADSQTIKLFAAAHSETLDLFASRPFDVTADAWSVRLGDSDLLQFLNNSLLYLQTNGTWDALEKKYDAHWLHENITYSIR